MLKEKIKIVFQKIGLDITKNMKYDRLTSIILEMSLRKDSNCIDIGCHKGEILDKMLTFSVNGKHYGFEPIPYLYEDLEKKYDTNVSILPYALSDKTEKSNFKIVKNSLGYSGLKTRKYNVKNPIIKNIEVDVKTLDTILSKDYKIDFVKIDVEGAEYNVIKGGFNLLKKWKPKIVFEFGKGASDYYNTTPKMIFNLLKDIGLNIFLLNKYINKQESLSLSQFETIYNNGSDYYFIAST